jgi:cytidylate kinase
MGEKQIIKVAIDGPAASGKTTVGRLLAKRLGVPFVDSGLFYRAVALIAKRKGIGPEDEASLVQIAQSMNVSIKDGKLLIDGVDESSSVTEPGFADYVSRISKLSGVRKALLARQRAYTKQSVVMVGRDIGTVVMPEASVKVFLTASDEVRVKRKVDELVKKGVPVTSSLLESEITERDRRDSSRSVAPLQVAQDAYIIDTSNMTPEEIVDKITRLVKGL